MEITIKNCNNIDEAKISIEPQKLNIKYGINGTGKSTIARALELNAAGSDGLSSLKPFKSRGTEQGTDEVKLPVILGADSFKNICVFNEKYVETFLFKPDGLLQNSFDIFIKTSAYDQATKEIEELLIHSREAFKKNAELEEIIKCLNELSNSIGNVGAVSSVVKAISSSRKTENIPQPLKIFEPIIRNSDNNINAKWISWHQGGSAFTSYVPNICPYCTASTKGTGDIISLIDGTYTKAKDFEHYNSLSDVINKLTIYLKKEAVLRLNEILRNETEPREEKSYLIGLKTQADLLRNKLGEVKNASFTSFEDVDKVVEEISSWMISMETIPDFVSDETIRIVDGLNSSLNLIKDKASELQGKVNILKNSIRLTIQKHEKEINEFLEFAGYKYVVQISKDGVIKLRHIDFEGEIESAKAHLSFGEKNAFALVLFMYDSLSKDPDLIILDDPISSFDNNKKFAILQTLFLDKGSYRNKTVLLLTHDIEPIIDIVKTLHNKFNSPKPAAHFLSTKSGMTGETVIERNDILPFSKICSMAINEHKLDVIKLIYLRRHYEILDEKAEEYVLLSNLFKTKEIPMKGGDLGDVAMEAHEIVKASESIIKLIPSFDYNKELENLNDDELMKKLYEETTNSYEKLQLFRVIQGESKEADSQVMKFVNETYHIENEYMVQLNPQKYDLVPEYIIEECNKIIQSTQPA